ncbi:OmpA family protein [Pelomonas sp. KK5]|uniref:OmpA family protein n=1 Tax=Pelomonas sp. KK5 TaxID=1855730 RepID=UPI00117D5127|nr:OmpA family protein [Pelomonas sp. KK5]
MNFKSLLPLLLVLPLAACMSTPPAHVAPISQLEQDVAATTDQLLAHWRARRSDNQSRLPPQPVALGDFVNLPAGGAVIAGYALPQTLASARARQVVAQRLAADTAADGRLLPVDAAGQAALLLTGQLAPALPPGGTQALTLLLLDAKTGQVLARAQGQLRGTAADAFPAAFDAESPVLITESAERAEAGARMFGSDKGASLDGSGLQSAAAATLLSQAQDAYVSGDYKGALALFERAAAMPGVNAIRAYNGQYLSLMKLGRRPEAMEAFRTLVAEGLGSRTLGIKLLFVPGQTEFLADPEIRGAYGDWLRVIANQSAASAAACLNVVGHTSHTGAETFNQELSLARSKRVRELLQLDAPALDRRIAVEGKGWSENIVGSGTDDARDAIDRRVEFRVVGCPEG